jgi:hypothetical protein
MPDFPAKEVGYDSTLPCLAHAASFADNYSACPATIKASLEKASAVQCSRGIRSAIKSSCGV